MIRLKLKEAVWLTGLMAASWCSLGAAPAVGPPAAPDPADLAFRAGAYEKALPLFQQKLAAATDAETAGKSLYHIGQCLTATQQYAKAVAAFENLVIQFPSSSWADRGLLRQGSVQCGLLKSPAAGITTWQSLIKKYPQSELIPEAQFLIGMIHWVHGRKNTAREAWNHLALRYPNHSRTGQAKLFLKER